MVRAKTGDTVAVSYIGTLDNGRIFDSTQEAGPLRFTLGAGEVFPALEAAVCGMAAGEVKNILIPNMFYRTDIGDRFVHTIELVGDAVEIGSRLFLVAGQPLVVRPVPEQARVGGRFPVAVADEVEVGLFRQPLLQRAHRARPLVSASSTHARAA